MPDLNLDQIRFEIPTIDLALPSNGLQRGAIHEFFYHDPLEPKALASTIPTLLAFNSHSLRATTYNYSTWNRDAAILETPKILWIGRRSWPAPPSLAALTARQQKLSTSFLNNSIFIDPPNDTTTLWAIDLALRSAGIDILIAACPSISRVTTQRLSLAAQKNGTTALLLRSFRDLKIPSSATSRWTIAPTTSIQSSPSWKLSLNKLRGGLLLNPEWIVSIVPPNLFKEALQPLTAKRLDETISALDLDQDISQAIEARSR